MPAHNASIDEISNDFKKCVNLILTLKIGPSFIFEKNWSKLKRGSYILIKY
jgi:hypothetical protein